MSVSSTNPSKKPYGQYLQAPKHREKTLPGFPQPSNLSIQLPENLNEVDEKIVNVTSRYLHEKSGFYRDGKRNGYGHEKLENGNLYTGMYQNGMSHGYGVLAKPDGKVRFAGKFEAGRKICGEEQIDDRTYFYGKYNSEGQKHFGFLVQFDPFNIIYYGIFKDEQPIEKKARSTGCIRDSKKLRYHEIVEEDGSLREGFFSNDGLQQGYGHFYCAKTQQNYIGLFKDGMYHGFGRLRISNREIIGEFEEGEPLTGQEISDSETCFVGSYKNLKRVHGVFVSQTGIAYFAGDFMDEQPHGNKIKWVKNGKVYEGNCFAGKFNGTVKITDGSGSYTRSYTNGEQN